MIESAAGTGDGVADRPGPDDAAQPRVALSIFDTPLELRIAAAWCEGLLLQSDVFESVANRFVQLPLRADEFRAIAGARLGPQAADSNEADADVETGRPDGGDGVLPARTGQTRGDLPRNPASLYAYLARVLSKDDTAQVAPNQLRPEAAASVAGRPAPNYGEGRVVYLDLAFFPKDDDINTTLNQVRTLLAPPERSKSREGSKSPKFTYVIYVRQAVQNGSFGVRVKIGFCDRTNGKSNAQLRAQEEMFSNLLQRALPTHGNMGPDLTDVHVLGGFTRAIRLLRSASAGARYESSGRFALSGVIESENLPYLRHLIMPGHVFWDLDGGVKPKFRGQVRTRLGSGANDGHRFTVNQGDVLFDPNFGGLTVYDAAVATLDTRNQDDFKLLHTIEQECSARGLSILSDDVVREILGNKKSPPKLYIQIGKKNVERTSSLALQQSGIIMDDTQRLQTKYVAWWLVERRIPDANGEPGQIGMPGDSGSPLILEGCGLDGQNHRALIGYLVGSAEKKPNEPWKSQSVCVPIRPVIDWISGIKEKRQQHAPETAKDQTHARENTSSDAASGRSRMGLTGPSPSRKIRGLRVVSEDVMQPGGGAGGAFDPTGWHAVEAEAQTFTSRYGLSIIRSFVMHGADGADYLEARLGAEPPTSMRRDGVFAGRRVRFVFVPASRDIVPPRRSARAV